MVVRHSNGNWVGGGWHVYPARDLLWVTMLVDPVPPLSDTGRPSVALLALRRAQTPAQRRDDMRETRARRATRREAAALRAHKPNVVFVRLERAPIGRDQGECLCTAVPEVLMEQGLQPHRSAGRREARRLLARALRQTRAGSRAFGNQQGFTVTAPAPWNYSTRRQPPRRRGRPVRPDRNRVSAHRPSLRARHDPGEGRRRDRRSPVLGGHIARRV